MKLFSQYITELFDRKIPYDFVGSGNGSYTYRFVLVEIDGKLQPAPKRKELDALVDSVVGDTTLDKHQKIQAFNKATKAYTYEVNLNDIKFTKEYAELGLMSDGDIQDNVWELSFIMRKAVLFAVAIGRPGRTGSYYFGGNTSTDDDINEFSGANASMIIGAVRDIAQTFVKEKSPRGIVVGTKPQANPARGKIYKALAKMAAQDGDGVYHEVEYARQGMSNSVIVWFDKKKPFALAESSSNKTIIKQMEREKEQTTVGVLGMSAKYMDRNIHYVDFGHNISPYEKDQEKEIEKIRQKVWGVKSNNIEFISPLLWVASPSIKPMKGMKYINVKKLKDAMRDTHEDVFPQLSSDNNKTHIKGIQGRIDYNRKVITAIPTSRTSSTGVGYSSRAVDAIYGELKSLYPDYQILDWSKEEE